MNSKPALAFEFVGVGWFISDVLTMLRTKLVESFMKKNVCNVIVKCLHIQTFYGAEPKMGAADQSKQ